MNSLSIIEKNGYIIFSVKVYPGASKNRIKGVLNKALQIDLQAQALEGKANKALIKFISEISKRPKTDISIVKGEKNRTKFVRIDQITSSDFEKILPLNTK